MSSAPQRTFTIAEYLAREEQSEIKHEFYRGEIFAMAGGSRNHADVISNLQFQIRSKIGDKGCRVSGSDQRIYIPQLDLDTYPDVSVVCGERQFEAADREANTNPILIVEVLSPSTERYDRTIKFGFYRKISTLKQYVLVSPDQAVVETFTRDDQDRWQFADAVGLEANVEIFPLNCSLSLAAIYEGVELDPTESRLRPKKHE